MNEPDIVELVQRMRRGDSAAREILAARIYERLVHLARRMRQGSPLAVRRWEQTEDLAHAAWFRIQRVLENENLTIQDEVHLLRLAARHLRFELIDLYRKHSGAQGLAANHQTAAAHRAGGPIPNDGERFSANATADPKRIVAWGEFHRLVEALPEPQKAIVDLLWYQGLEQRAAAALLGVDVKTVKRRWRDVKVRLADNLDGSLIEY
ncbi:MAG: sigma-70 family RNA polymerase sigma factor [Planctomycetales bacterium]|nr:sigma-70 family RNA polymerase sigma factor [Planctomycetales bacterium]